MYDYTFSNNRPANKKNIAIIMVLCVALGFVIVSFLFMPSTLYDCRIPIGVCLVPACFAGWLLGSFMRKHTHIKTKAASIITSIILLWSFFTAATFTLNFCLSKHDTSQAFEAKVVNARSVTRTRSHRRHREQYTAYVITVQLPNDETKIYDVSVREFTQYHIGDVIPLHIEQGFFGMPVIKEFKLPLPAKTKKSRKK